MTDRVGRGHRPPYSIACRGKGGNNQKSGDGGANNDQLVANVQKISRLVCRRQIGDGL